MKDLRLWLAQNYGALLALALFVLMFAIYIGNHAAGLTVPVDEDLGACLAEVEYLNASIGRTGMLALKPLRVSSHRDEWHRFLLQQAGRGDQLKARERSRRLTSLLKK